MKNARQHHIGVNKIVLTGHSAGSYLARISGTLPASAGLDRLCTSAAVPAPNLPEGEPKIAAIVNWSGATDVSDLLEGPKHRLGLHGDPLGISGKESAVKMLAIPFGMTDWSQIERTAHKGERGFAYWRTQNFGSIRVRMVEYTPGYVADHWCVKGHILLCTEGELHTELKDGRRFTLKPGTSYQVADNEEPHRSSTEVGATLFIVD